MLKSGVDLPLQNQVAQERHPTREGELVSVRIESEKGEVRAHRGQKGSARRVHEG